MYVSAALSTIAAWFIGLVIDANFGTGDWAGFAELRILLPVLVMGLFILKAINKKK